MPQPFVTTWHDAIEHCREYVAGGGDAYNENHFFKATNQALQELCRTCTWNYYWTHSWVSLDALYETGTIAYDHTGGAYERMVTLSSGTWPTNAAYGMLLIDDVAYKVEDRKSSTIITLTADTNPGADVAASTEYQWFRTEYTLPSDWRKGTTPSYTDWWNMKYVTPEELYARERAARSSTSTSYLYTITADTNLYGSMSLRIYPAPSEAKTLAFVYQRWPRQLKVSGLASGDYTGTITTAGTTTVTGSGTAFSQKHVGCILRPGSDGTNIPTGYDGRYPPEDERVITAVASATSLTVDAAISTLSAVKFRISDPIDVHQGMLGAYWRNCEKQLNSRQRDYEVAGMVKQAWREELELAIANDHAFAGSSTAGENYAMPWWYGSSAPIEMRMGV